MYAERQNKEKVSRRIDATDCGVRQRVRMMDDNRFLIQSRGQNQIELNSPIQRWKPGYKNNDNDPIDDERIVYLINETGSWHGHTVLAVEGWEPDGYGGGRKWLNVWSFIPEDERSAKNAFGGIYGAVPAKIDARHENGGDYRLSPNKEVGWAKKVTRKEYNTLEKVINAEKELVTSGKVKYVAIGYPVGFVNGLVHWEWHDNCNSWANKVLRKAGIISSIWGLNYYLPSIPVLSSKLYNTSPLQDSNFISSDGQSGGNEHHDT